MTSIAEFTLAARDFPLGRLFDDWPDATLELDRVVPSGDTVMPYFWVRDDEAAMGEVLAVFEGLPELRSVTLMEDLGERGLFRAEWKPEHLGIMSAIPATGVTVLAATGSREGWVFELRAPSADRFGDFQDYCDEHAIDVTLTRLRRLSEGGDDDDAHGLTPEQREALELAYSEGYYDDPRRTDQAALADQLGISRQALSARLRRGYRALLEDTVVTERSGEE